MVDTIARHDQHRLADHFYSGPKGIALLPPEADDLLASLGGLLSALEEVRGATDKFVLADGETAEFYFRQVVVLKDAIEDINAVLGPVLRRPRKAVTTPAATSQTSSPPRDPGGARRATPSS